MKRTKQITILMLCLLIMVLNTFSVTAKMTDNGIAAMSISLNDAFEEQALTYARILCLKHSGTSNGTLFVTADQHSWVNGEQVWPIYRSTDGGNTWSHVSDVKDETFGTNRKAQPMLYELPVGVGNLQQGTLLLAGNLVPDDQSSSRLVIYKSTDLGATWTLLSTVDTGGPFEYDPSPTSTTTTVWEPFLYTDDYGHLVCAFSDERQKADGVLQALSLRYTSDGVNWSPLQNIVAIGNRNDRPGMVTVAKMSNGKYIATYEVVNRPSLTQNSSVVYYKISEDGLNWNPLDLGTLITNKDGLSLGSSPYVKWVNAGGPNGMVIVGSKWAIDTQGNILQGGQNFFVNYNFGEGTWERYPQPLTWDGQDIQYLDAFSQSLETNVDDTVLYEAANIVNSAKTGIDLRVGTLPLTMAVYEAENASITGASIGICLDSSNGKEVGYINYPTSEILFNKIVVPTTGSYKVFVRYNNGMGSTSSHLVSVNNGTSLTVQYPPTADWNRYLWTSFDCNLNAGNNTISLKFNGSYAEIDCIAIEKTGVDLSQDFMLKNRNSSLYLEVPSMSTSNDTVLAQYDFTNYPCQLWDIKKNPSGYFTLKNVNSSKMCQILNSSTLNGAKAVQYTADDSNNQMWSISAAGSGYFYFRNRNSNKLLEVTNASTANGAEIGQWQDASNNCQQWTLIKEGIR